MRVSVAIAVAALTPIGAAAFGSDESMFELNRPESELHLVGMDGEFLFQERTELELQNELVRDAKWLTDQCAGKRSKEDREALRSCVRWATGLEHESILVHRTEDGVEEYAINAGSVIRDMALYVRVHGLDRRTHSVAVGFYHTGAEYTGRRCSGMAELNFKAMTESVSMDYKELTFDAAFCQIETIDSMLLDIMSAHPNTKKMTEHVGPVRRPRTGMSTELGMYRRTDGKFYACSSCGSCDLKDYTGSYHVSISLPSDPEGWILKNDSVLLDRNTCAGPSATSQLSSAWSMMKDSLTGNANAQAAEELKHTRWVDAHANFGNMVQWVEPLLSAAFDSADAHSVCDRGYYTEGSFRTMGTGWGVPGTTDVRTFKHFGTGRLASKGFEWLFPDDVTAAPRAYRDDLVNCIGEGMGSDIRVKSKVNEHHMGQNETLPAMEVGQGVEIRIFDNFPIEHLPHVYRFIAIVAEAGRLHTAPHYVYDDEDWNAAFQRVMKEGWNAILPKNYVVSLAEALDLPELLIDLDGNTQAFHVFSVLYGMMWEKHKDGMWAGLLLDELPESVPDLPNPNRDSWEIGAINAGFTPDEILSIFGIDRANGRLSREPVLLENISLDSKDDECSEDVEDLVYLAESFGMISRIDLHPDGSMESFVFESEENWSREYSTAPTCTVGFGTYEILTESPFDNM